MIDLSRNGYSHEQVKEVLHMVRGSRQIRFRYFLLDKNENEIGEISHLVESGNIENQAFAEIKRTAKFRLKDSRFIDNNGEEREINWITDRIQVFVEFKVPDQFEQVEETSNKKEGGWVDFSLGIFILSSPTRKEEGRSVYREVEAYDKLLIVKEDKVTERYTIPAGTKYYDAMVQVLTSAGITKYSIENDEKTLPTDKEFDPGTEKLAILNDLASDLGFTQLWVDEYGYFRTSRYRPPEEQATDYIYEDDEISVIYPGTEEEMDLFDLPNVFVVTVANPDTEEEFVSIVENTNPNHPRSIPNLGRRVVRVEEKDNIADQEALDAYTARIAQEASQIFGKIRFETAIMPFHSYGNILQFRNRTLGINNKYFETSWSMNLEPGATMIHEARRTVRLA